METIEITIPAEVFAKAIEPHMESTIMKALLKHDQIKEESNGDHTYTINQVAHRLKMSFSTVKKLVVRGILKQTGSGRITESAIRDYLSNK